MRTRHARAVGQSGFKEPGYLKYTHVTLVAALQAQPAFCHVFGCGGVRWGSVADPFGSAELGRGHPSVGGALSVPGSGSDQRSAELG